MSIYNMVMVIFIMQTIKVLYNYIIIIICVHYIHALLGQVYILKMCLQFSYYSGNLH